MKKTLPLLLFAFAALACSKKQSFSDQDAGKSKQSLVMSIADVQDLALKLPSTFSDDPQTRSSAKRIKEIVPFTKFKNNAPRTRSTDPNAPSLDDVYVVNYENEQGFAIICADKRLPDVIGYSDSGSISDTMSNPGMRMVMELIPNYVATMAAGGGPGSIDEEDFFNPDPDKPNPNYIITGTTIRYTDYEKSVLPLIKVKWGQYQPFNDFLPVCLNDPHQRKQPAGCVPMAMMQIMSYYKRSASVNGQSLNWDLISNIEYGSGFYFNANRGVMSDLSAMIGRGVGISYGCGASGTADYGKIRQTFDEHGYTTEYGGYNFETVKANINIGKPVFIGGYGDKNWIGTVRNGHAWVIDGLAGYYKLKVRFKDTYINFTRVSSEDLEVENLGFQTVLVHCNWGYDGINNGYFSAWLFDVDMPILPDQGSPIVTHPDTYQYELKTIHNITLKP